MKPSLAQYRHLLATGLYIVVDQPFGQENMTKMYSLRQVLEERKLLEIPRVLIVVQRLATSVQVEMTSHTFEGQDQDTVHETKDVKIAPVRISMHFFVLLPSKWKTDAERLPLDVAGILPN